jgi:hypothetical protein
MFKKMGVVALNAVITAMLLMLVSSTSSAQVTGGRVTGTVIDANGEVVPNANVILRNAAIGQELTTQTTDTGAFTYPNVAVGEYTVTIEASGFSPVTQNVKVALNQESSLAVTLQVSGIGATTVEVTAASEALVQTDSSQLGKSFDTRQVLDLPIFGNQNALALLSPNVVGQAAGTAGSGGSVGGTRPRGNSFQVDGTDNNDPSVTGPRPALFKMPRKSSRS